MKFVAGAALALAAAVPAAATTIDFSDQVNGPYSGALVYPDATFTSSTGSFYIGAAGVQHEICPLTAQNNCEATLTVTFNSAVNGLKFVSSGDDAFAQNLFVHIVTDNGEFDYLGWSDGNGGSGEGQDLSAYANVLSITLSTTDAAGLAYDYFEFNDTTAPAPEPASWALMLAGFGLVGGAMRRRTSVVRFS
jgi:hypothetical protein